MKLGIIGLPGSGRSTVFAALTGARGEESDKGQRKDQRIGTVRVMDDRVDFLSRMYQPKKTTYAQVEYLLPSEGLVGSSSQTEGALWNQVRICDALIRVLRHFRSIGGTEPTPEADFWALEEEMTLNDLMVVEKRLERIELDKKRGKGPENDEESLLLACRTLLENNQPIRLDSELSTSPVLKGFTLLSAKPQLVIINNEDDDESMLEWQQKPEGLEIMVVRGRLEMDIAAMAPEEAREFFAEYNINDAALDRVIQSSYKILNQISFFTVGEDEVKAWTIHQGTPALEAAGEIHTDIQKGFIRAEVLAYDDLQKCGSFKDAKKAGLVRLEGKEYMVRDGDIIHFRFNI
ncbi:MAG: redox-regulated ATPase YchF [Deltaproteobacteria bacterium]|nr:redox-regulated ATPase YchF [Deltaproteobacteria bacterium]